MKVVSRPIHMLLLCSLFLLPQLDATAQVAVRYTEGLVHGFLVLKTPEGEILAHGDLSQTARGGNVTSRLTFHFKDGSLREETAVFSQQRYFRLLRYHVTQKGPAFEDPQQLSIDVPAGKVEVRSTDRDGQPKIITENMKLPPDLANGLLFILLKNIPADSAETKASMIVTTPKPRLVKLAISAEGEDCVTGRQRETQGYPLRCEDRTRRHHGIGSASDR
jgi:hypothetical protein